MTRVFKQVRCWILVQLTHNVALPLLRLVRRPSMFPYTMEQLHQFPEETLGQDLYTFLKDRNLQLLQHYARHDLKHIVLGYDTTEAGEACLQCFMLGNGRISFPVLATVIFSVVTMPEYWKAMLKAYRQGRASTPIHNWKWSAILHENTESLRKRIFNN
ncbi:MAG TPA: Coq4 family protein [Chitinophagaceae bacterium]